MSTYEQTAYYHDNLYFSFALCEKEKKLALGLKVSDEGGALLVSQSYPFDGSSTAASWLFYWQLLAAAGRERKLETENTPTYSEWLSNGLAN